MFDRVRPSHTGADVTAGRPSPPQLERLQLELADARRTIARLADEKERALRHNFDLSRSVLLDSNDDAPARTAASDERVAALERALREQGDQAASVVAQWQRAVEDVRCQLDLTRSERDALRVQVEQNCTLLKDQSQSDAQTAHRLERAMEELETRKAEVRTLKEDAERTGGVVAELQRNVRSANQEAESGKHEVESIRSELRRRTEQVGQLRSELLEVNAANDAAKALASRQRHELQAVTEKVSQLETKGATVDELRACRDSLLADLRAANQAITKVDREREEAQRRADDMASDVDEHRATMKVLQRQVDDLAKTLQAAEEHNVVLSTELATALQHADGSMQHWESVGDKLAQHLGEMTTTFESSLAAKWGALEQASTARIESVEAQSNLLQQQLSQARYESHHVLQSREATIEQLRVEANEKDQCIRQLTSQLEETSTRLRAESVENQHHVGQLASLQHIQAEHAQRVGVLQTEAEALRKTVRDLELERTSFERAHYTMSAKLSDVSKELETACAQRDAAEKIREDLARRLTSLSAFSENFQHDTLAQYARLQEDLLTAREADLDRLRTGLAQVQRSIERQSHSSHREFEERLHAQRRQFDDKVAEVQEQLRSTRGEVRRLTSENDALRVERTRAVDRIESLGRELESKQRDNDAAKLQLESEAAVKKELKTVLSEWKAKVSRQQNALQELDADRLRVIADRDRLQGLLEVAQQKGRDLRALADATSARKQEGDEHTSQVKLRLAAAERSVEVLRQRIAEATAVIAKQQRTLKEMAAASRLLQAAVRSPHAAVAAGGSLSIQPLNVVEGPRRQPKKRSASVASVPRDGRSQSAAMPSQPMKATRSERN